MPPVILWALVAVGAAVAGRFLMKEQRRVNAELHPDAAGPVDEPASVRKLERDPATGVYRPRCAAAG
jgi:hypothetical protein